MQRSRTLGLALICCLAGCERPAVVGSATIEKQFPNQPDLDVLFVIDNSLSTQDKQALFAQNFTRLAAELDGAPGGRPNLHLGIVSTTVGTGSDAIDSGNCSKTAPNDDGRFVHVPRAVTGCTGPTGAFFSDVSDGMGGRITNYQGTLPDAFSCIAQLGTGGCGFEEPLEAMKRALDGSHAENAGFLRPEADLAVVILTDEDDCSASDPALFSLANAGPSDFRCQPLYAYDCDQPISATAPGDYTGCHPRHGGYLGDVESYVTFLKHLKNPSQLLVTLIAGDPSTTIHTGTIEQPFAQSLALLPSCQTTIDGNLAIARPALRLDAFRRAFGDRGVFETVCQDDYSGALAQIGDSMLDMMSNCLDPEVDLDQPRCTVTERDAVGTPGETDVLIPACGASGARPCWQVQASAACGAGGALEIERVAPPPPGSVIDAVCAARP